MVYKWLNNIQCLFLPSSCSLCGSQNISVLDICEACCADLPWIEHACSICGHETDVSTGPICGQCLTRPPLYDHCFMPLRYQIPVNHFIISLKFRQKLHIARLLGQLFLHHLQIQQKSGLHLTMPNALLPVPLHPRRIRQRGYNQALEISRHLGRQLNLPILTNTLFRSRHTPPQSNLPAEERRANIRGAFQCMPKNMPGKLPRHIAVIDDVVTTGQTVNEITRVLRKAGVQEVSVWAIANASLK